MGTRGGGCRHGHNMLMIGPPGAGKSMLAARLPGILPSLSPEEALEVSMVHSVRRGIDQGWPVATAAIPRSPSLGVRSRPW
ncbi:MAG: magnesium chelatase family protein [Rhodospirillaceae bacterium]|nr:MAG: magnesium chelatase family protein [Rhodospirillaceae bacterium]